jgi:hypothetical protein
MCDCIKINYIPIGGEPVSTEVISNGIINSKNYYEFSIPAQSSGCDTISITYQLIGEEPVTVEVESSGVDPETNKPYYDFNINETGVQIYPLINEFYNNWVFSYENDVEAFIPIDTPCPFGTYTIEEGSIFEAFEVSLVSEQSFTISWDGIKWCLFLGESLLWVLAEDEDCPIGNWDNESDTTYFSGFSTEECEPKRTVTYSKVSEGWNSFWSYQPDWMTEMNSTFYTFKEGELWKHNVNTTRNNFYGQQYGSKIRTIFNEQPLEVKVFNTLSLNSTHTWTADIYTNISAGSIDYTYFVEKENQWFAYIRRFDNTIDVKALSTQGVGSANSIDITDPTAVELNFSFNVDSSISIGDKLYKNSGSNLILVGTIVGISSNMIIVDTSVGSIPLITDFLISVKNSQAESFGSRGYYMNVYLSNDLTEEVKLFAIGSSVFKSFL